MTITTEDDKTYTAKTLEKTRKNVAEKTQFKMFQTEEEEFQFGGPGTKNQKEERRVSVSDQEEECDPETLANIKEDSREYEIASERKTSGVSASMAGNIAETGLYSKPFLISSSESLEVKPPSTKPIKLSKGAKRKQEISASEMSTKTENPAHECALESSSKVVKKIDNILNKRMNMSKEAVKNIAQSPKTTPLQYSPHSQTKLKFRTSGLTTGILPAYQAPASRNRSSSMGKGVSSQNRSKSKQAGKPSNFGLGSALLSDRKESSSSMLKFLEECNKSGRKVVTPKLTAISPRNQFSSFTSTLSAYYSCKIGPSKQTALSFMGVKKHPGPKAKEADKSLQSLNQQGAMDSKGSPSSRHSRIRSKLDKYLSAGISGLATESNNKLKTSQTIRTSPKSAKNQGSPLNKSSRSMAIGQSPQKSVRAQAKQLQGNKSNDISFNLTDADKDMSTSLFSANLAMLKKSSPQKVAVSSPRLLENRREKTGRELGSRGETILPRISKSRPREQLTLGRGQSSDSKSNTQAASNLKKKSPISGSSARATPKMAVRSKVTLEEGTSVNNGHSASFSEVKTGISKTKKTLTATELARWAKSGMSGQLYLSNRKL